MPKEELKLLTSSNVDLVIERKWWRQLWRPGFGATHVGVGVDHVQNEMDRIHKAVQKISIDGENAGPWRCR